MTYFTITGYISQIKIFFFIFLSRETQGIFLTNKRQGKTRQLRRKAFSVLASPCFLFLSLVLLCYR